MSALDVLVAELRRDVLDEDIYMQARRILAALPAAQGGGVMVNVVNVRWFDGYLETFAATEVRFGSDLLWMRLADGTNRHIPLRTVRWFALSQESHAALQATEAEGGTDNS